MRANALLTHPDTADSGLIMSFQEALGHEWLDMYQTFPFKPCGRVECGERACSQLSPCFMHGAKPPHDLGLRSLSMWVALYKSGRPPNVDVAFVEFRGAAKERTSQRSACL